MDAICNYCDKETAVEFEERKHPRGLRETYFRCNRCGEHYTCFVTDARVRRLHKEVKAMRGKGASAEVKQAKINRRMDELKRKLKGGGSNRKI